MKQPEESLSTEVQKVLPFLRTGIAVLIFMKTSCSWNIPECFGIADKFLNQLVKDVEASE